MASNGVFGIDGLRFRFLVVFALAVAILFLTVFLRITLRGIVNTLSQLFQLQHMFNTRMDTN